VPSASLPDEFVSEAKEVRDEVLYRVRYKGYLDRERQLADKLRSSDRVRLPDEMDFRAVPGLKKETADKLACIRPTTLGQAQRVSGVTPADVAILMVHAARFSGGMRERGA
jgi:tRNA uridine 5-carboxymethylaminomethyl modification enzyme